MREISTGLASVEERLREQALARLRAELPGLPAEGFKPLCIGLYYYFWYCDGPERQERAAAEIAQMEALAGAGAWAWRRALIGVLVKFWDRLDYHRTNKYLGLFREVFQFIYQGVFGAPQRKEALKEWNAYFAEAVLAEERAKPLLLELIYIAGQALLPPALPAPLVFLFCKPFFDLLSFSRDRVLRNAVSAHFFAALAQRLPDAEVRRRLAAYLRSYTAAPELPLEALKGFAELVFQLESEQPRAAPGVPPPRAGDAPRAEEEEEEAQSAEEAPLPGIVLEEDEDEVEEEENSGFLSEEDLLDAGDEELFDEGDAEELEDPNAYLSFDDLQQSVPPYYFKTAKQKRKFFKQMNQQYFASMGGGAAKKIRKEVPNVKFNLAQVQIKKFHKHQIIDA